MASVRGGRRGRVGGDDLERALAERVRAVAPDLSSMLPDLSLAVLQLGLGCGRRMMRSAWWWSGGVERWWRTLETVLFEPADLLRSQVELSRRSSGWRRRSRHRSSERSDRNPSKSARVEVDIPALLAERLLERARHSLRLHRRMGGASKGRESGKCLFRPSGGR